MHEYEESVKAYRDIVNAVNTARMEGRAEGRAEGLEEGVEKGRAEERKGIARSLKAMGLDAAAIHKATGLAPEEIQKL